MSFIEQIGYYGLQTLATPLLWWTLAIAVVLAYLKCSSVKRPQFRYYVTFAVLISLPVGIILSFMPSSVYTSITAPATMKWIAAPELTIISSESSGQYIQSQSAFWAGISLLAGFFIILLSAIRLAVNFLNLRTIKLQARPVFSNQHTRLIRDLQNQLNITRPVQLLIHNELTSPISFGWKAPVIVIPESCRSAELSKMQTIFLHELEHIKNSDYLLSLITEFITTITAFHPGTWILRNQLYRNQELHCDARVLGYRPCSPAEYARILLSFSTTGNTPPHERVVCSMARNRSLIHERIQLMNSDVGATKSAGSSSAIGAYASAFCLFLAITVVISSDLTPSGIEDDTNYFSGFSTTSEPELISNTTDILSNLDLNPDEIEGDQVKIEVAVNPGGNATNTHIVESAGEYFDEKLSNALMEAEWEPAHSNGEPIDGITTIGIEFASGNHNSEPQPVGGIEAIFEELEYPDNARSENIEGTVVVEFIVNEQGGLEDKDILSEIGGGAGEAALEAAASVQWEPGYENGEPVATNFQLPVRFTLDES